MAQFKLKDLVVSAIAEADQSSASRGIENLRQWNNKYLEGSDIDQLLSDIVDAVRSRGVILGSEEKDSIRSKLKDARGKLLVV